jgi:peroxiredoxin
VIGEPAPEFELEGTDGKVWSLARQRGRRVVLIFYVIDHTPL